MTNIAPTPPLVYLSEALEPALERLTREHVIERIWQHDPSLWPPSTEPGRPGRLGWLEAPARERASLPALNALHDTVRREGIDTAVVCGMGGSSLGAGLIASSVTGSGLATTVLDTTHPATIAAITARLRPDNTLWIIASKSGTTIETRAHLEHFWAACPDGAHYAAVTDDGTPLAALAAARGFRHVSRTPESVGGRFSALTGFGLLPAALAGADVEALLDGASAMAEACRGSGPASNPGAMLGAVLGAAPATGRDKLFIDSSPALPHYFPWIEQLVAESLGKSGLGLVPCQGRAPAGVPAEEVLQVAIGGGPHGHSPEALHLASDSGAFGLGAELFRWEFAIAVAGFLIGVHPFDQPDVESAKAAARSTLDHGLRPGESTLPSPITLLEQAAARDYVALQAFLEETPESTRRLDEAAARITSRYGLPVTANFGPRYLHSTGQLHKGGPESVICLQVYQEPASDQPVPGAGYTFGDLFRAQADGDLTALRLAGRRVSRLAPNALDLL